MPTEPLETLSAADGRSERRRHRGRRRPRIRRSRGGPGGAPLLRPEVPALEQSAIFERTWQLAGHVSDLPEPGSYVTASAGSQSVIVIRGKDGELRAFRNVCRHRGRRLIGEASGCSRAIR